MGVSGESGDGYCLVKEKVKFVPDLNQLMHKMDENGKQSKRYSNTAWIYQ